MKRCKCSAMATQRRFRAVVDRGGREGEEAATAVKQRQWAVRGRSARASVREWGACDAVLEVKCYESAER